MFVEKEREVDGMSKMEMVNRLIIMGCVKESQRTYLMKRDAKNLLKLYIHLVSKKVG